MMYLPSGLKTCKTTTTVGFSIAMDSFIFVWGKKAQKI